MAENQSCCTRLSPVSTTSSPPPSLPLAVPSYPAPARVILIAVSWGSLWSSWYTLAALLSLMTRVHSRSLCKLVNSQTNQLRWGKIPPYIPYTAQHMPIVFRSEEPSSVFPFDRHCLHLTQQLEQIYPTSFHKRFHYTLSSFEVLLCQFYTLFLLWFNTTAVTFGEN